MSPGATNELAPAAASPGPEQEEGRDRAASCADGATSSEHTIEVRRREKPTDSAQDAASGHAVKRIKRGKYISRAWYA